MTGQLQCSTVQRSKSVLNPMQGALADAFAVAPKMSDVAAGTASMNDGIAAQVLRPMNALEEHGGVRSAV